MSRVRVWSSRVSLKLLGSSLFGAFLLSGGCSDTEEHGSSSEASARTLDTVPFVFSDVTAGSGIAVETVSGDTPSTQILEVKGGGLALIDFDQDGDRDLFVPNGATLSDPEAGPRCQTFSKRRFASVHRHHRTRGHHPHSLVVWDRGGRHRCRWSRRHLHRLLRP